jgi:hypothetical protein
MWLELREKNNKDPTFVSKFTMGDERWIYSYCYDTETNNYRRSGRPHNYQEHKSTGRSTVQQKKVYIDFVKVTGNFHGKFVPKNTTVNSDSPVRFWNAWGKMCDEKFRKFGANTISSFITTTRQPTFSWTAQSLWLTTTWLTSPFFPTRRT